MKAIAFLSKIWNRIFTKTIVIEKFAKEDYHPKTQFILVTDKEGVLDSEKQDAVENITPSRPLEVRIKNASDQTQIIRLWDKESLLKKVNHQYVHIYQPYNPGQSYKEMLQRLKKVTFKIGLLYIQVISGKAKVSLKLTEHYVDESGTEMSREHYVKMSPMQQQSDICEYYPSQGIVISRDSVWELELPENSCIQISAYPEQIITKK